MTGKLPSIYDAIVKSLHPILRKRFGDDIPLPYSISNEDYIKRVSKSFNPKTVFNKKDPDWFGNVPIYYIHHEYGSEDGGTKPIYAFSRWLIFPIENIIGVAEGRAEDIDYVVGTLSASIYGDWASAALACCTVTDGIGLLTDTGFDHSFELEPEYYVITPDEFRRISGLDEGSEFKINGFSPLPPINGLSRIEVSLSRSTINPDYDPEMAAEADRDASFNSAMYDAGMSYMASPLYRGSSASLMNVENIRLRFKMSPERARDVATKPEAMRQLAKNIKEALDADRAELDDDRQGGTLCRDCWKPDPECWCGFPGPSMRDHYPKGNWKGWSDQVGYGMNEPHGVVYVKHDLSF